jgi:hypothetical protein
MFLKDKQTGHLVEVMDLSALFDPLQSVVMGRIHAGEEMQDPADFDKAELIFPSGESLPRYWVDAHYRSTETTSG